MARILDFYAVRWEYEPDTFPILWNLDGDVVESFSPDFYLPDLDLYLEMTTLRQRLVRKKNRKLRRLRELYPAINIKLFYARDFRALMLKYGKVALADGLSGTSGQVATPYGPSTRPGRVAAGTASAASLPERRPPWWMRRARLLADTPWGYDDGMATTTGRRPAPAPDPSHLRHSYSKDTAQLMRRLSRMEGQVRGIARMIEREEYCVDILQQTAALRAAVDALSIIVLEDHVQGCVRTAAERGEADQYVDEVIDVVRRTLGRPVRGGTRAT